MPRGECFNTFQGSEGLRYTNPNYRAGHHSPGDNNHDASSVTHFRESTTAGCGFSVP